MPTQEAALLFATLFLACGSPAPGPAAPTVEPSLSAWSDPAVLAMLEVVRRYDQGVQFDAGLNPADAHHNARKDAVFAYQADLFGPLVAEWGWPQDDHGEGSVGEQLFLIAQHADDRPETQAEMYEAMKSGHPDTPDARELLAFLTDRVRKNKGEPQVYGTQMVHDGGECAFWTIEDRKVADELRAQLGMASLEEEMVAHKAFEQEMKERYLRSREPAGR